MRGLKDVSKLAAAAALMFGVTGVGTFACSSQESSVDAAPPVQDELVELDETDDMGAGNQIDEIDEVQEEDAQY